MIKLKKNKYYNLRFSSKSWGFRFERFSETMMGDRNILTSGYIIDFINKEFIERKEFNVEEADIYGEIEFTFIKKYLPNNHTEIVEDRNKRIKLLLNV